MTIVEEWDDDVKLHPETEYKFTHEVKTITFTCTIKRIPHSETWCGYVQVPETHPYHGKHYGEITFNVDVHGGLTYGYSDELGFGFDTAGYYDIAPAYIKLSRMTGLPCLMAPGAKYRTWEYVKQETINLAEQFAMVYSLPSNDGNRS